jgi:branched-chain amino acid transport system permease protein
VSTEPQAPAAAPGPRERVREVLARPLVTRWVLPGLALFLALSYPWWPAHPISMDTMVVIVVYVMLALGLNIVVGYAGLLDLGYVAFFALGAYTLGWFGSGLFDGVTLHLGSVGNAELPGIHLSFWLVLILAGVISAIAGVIIGWPTLRLRGDYLAIVTLGFGEIIPDVFRNGDAMPVPNGFQGTPPFLAFDTYNLTNGVRGVTQLDRPGFGDTLSSATGGLLPDRFSSLDLTPWYLVILVMCLVTIFVNQRLRDSKMGRAWIAVREDEVAASAMGVPLMRTKLWSYGIGAVFGGFAGCFYGAFINGIFPTSFSFQISVIILCMVIVGGMGNLWGVVLGAVVLAWLNFEGLNQIGRVLNDVIGTVGIEATVDVPKYKLAIFGALLVSMMLFRPGGFIPSARRKAELEEEGDGPEMDVYDDLYDIRERGA